MPDESNTGLIQIEGLHQEIKCVQEKLSEVQHGLKEAQNWIGDIQDKYELAKAGVSSGNEKNYPNLSADNIYRKFKYKYQKGYQIDRNVLLMVIVLIVSFILLLCYYYFGLYCLFSSIPSLWKSVLLDITLIIFSICIFLKVKKDFKKIPQQSFIVGILWIIAIVAVLVHGILISKLTIFVNFFFLSLYIISITGFVYGNFKDDDKIEVDSKITALFTNYNIVDSSLDMLINYSEKIEDEAVSAIREFINGKFFLFFLSGLGIFFGVFLDKIGYDIMVELVKAEREAFAKNLILILITIDCALPFVILINLLHKAFNWKANIYKEVLRDIRLTLALKSNKKIQ